MINKVPQNSRMYANYLEGLKGKIYKILPLIEEENEGVYHYVDSLIFELYGLQYVIDGVSESQTYISLLSGLEALPDELIVSENNFNFIRSEIFKMIGLVEKLQEKGVSK